MHRYRFLLCFLACLANLLYVEAGTLAQFRTVFGDIEVELYDQDKPVTVQNFIQYVQSGRYQNLFAHRIVTNFVIQGGGYTVTNRNATNLTFMPVPVYPKITNEFGVGRRFSNVYGTLSMAKLGGDTNSASAQWFFNLADNTRLDAPDTNNFFVVFGHVIRGTNILNLFNGFQPWDGVSAPMQSTNLDLHQYFAAPFGDLPLLRPGFANSNLVFMDISLLQASIKPALNGSNEISWSSPLGLTNILEYSTNLPGSWHLLVSSNGTGNTIKVVDSAPNPSRFYRVRVVY